jgi:DNA polymerase
LTAPSIVAHPRQVQSGIDRLTRAQAAAMLRWWLDAGVDQLVDEQPRDWLRTRSERAGEDKRSAVGQPAVATLQEFHAWLATAEHLPLAQAGAKRVLPHGPANAALMLVSEAPARDDAADGRPIGGDSWRLAERMLQAIGIAPDEAYSASLACFHLSGARLTGEALEQAAAIVRRQVELVAPRRLLLLGDSPCRALLGQSLAASRGRLHRVGGVPTVATFHPRFLIQRPADKLLAWQDLLLLAKAAVE